VNQHYHLIFVQSERLRRFRLEDLLHVLHFEKVIAAAQRAELRAAALLGAIRDLCGIYLYLVIIWVSVVLVLKKVGLLALIVGLVVQNVLVVFPMTSHLSRWYANAGLTGIAVITALLIYGFFTGLAGRPLFTGAALDK